MTRTGSQTSHRFVARKKTVLLQSNTVNAQSKWNHLLGFGKFLSVQKAGTTPVAASVVPVLLFEAKA